MSLLMSKFQIPDRYVPQPHTYTLLPFDFARVHGGQYILTNIVGEYILFPETDLAKLIDNTLPVNHPKFLELKTKHFLFDNDSSVATDLLSLKLRTKLSILSQFTSLHIFVTTLRCDHSCPYCQVSRVNDQSVQYDMSQDTALKAISLMFRSPSRALKVEFQGGESLLNLPLMRFIVREVLERNKTYKRDIVFVIATNLALLTDDLLDFADQYSILISTSLDGPADLHNANRPRHGNDSYQRTISSIQRVRARLGKDQVGALMTTTAASLNRVKDIIDEYIKQDFRGIFLRPLSPYGFAIKTKSYNAYNEDRWLEFYFEGLDYIIDINLGGFYFTEFYAAMVLKKMLTPLPTAYVDLQSPAGVGISAIVYNYDGEVYASDESRMLAEMNDTYFSLGNVHTNTYEDIFLSDKLLDTLDITFTQSVPMCHWCAFEPFCGVDPVYHYATQKDVIGKKPLSGFCKRNMELFRGLIKRLDRPEVRLVFEKWAYQQ